MGLGWDNTLSVSAASRCTRPHPIHLRSFPTSPVRPPALTWTSFAPNSVSAADLSYHCFFSARQPRLPPTTMHSYVSCYLTRLAPPLKHWHASLSLVSISSLFLILCLRTSIIHEHVFAQLANIHLFRYPIIFRTMIMMYLLLIRGKPWLCTISRKPIFMICIPTKWRAHTGHQVIDT